MDTVQTSINQANIGHCITSLYSTTGFQFVPTGAAIGDFVSDPKRFPEAGFGFLHLPDRARPVQVGDVFTVAPMATRLFAGELTTEGTFSREALYFGGLQARTAFPLDGRHLGYLDRYLALRQSGGRLGPSDVEERGVATVAYEGYMFSGLMHAGKRNLADLATAESMFSRAIRVADNELGYPILSAVAYECLAEANGRIAEINRDLHVEMRKSTELRENSHSAAERWLGVAVANAQSGQRSRFEEAAYYALCDARRAESFDLQRKTFDVSAKYYMQFGPESLLSYYMARAAWAAANAGSHFYQVSVGLQAFRQLMGDGFDNVSGVRDMFSRVFSASRFYYIAEKKLAALKGADGIVLSFGGKGKGSGLVGASDLAYAIGGYIVFDEAGSQKSKRRQREFKALSHQQQLNAAFLAAQDILDGRGGTPDTSKDTGETTVPYERIYDEVGKHLGIV